jgi:MraZ protein
MVNDVELIVGEFPRVLDDRFRVSLPQELVEPLVGEQGECILAKERRGCLSLWSKDRWQNKLQSGVDLVLAKIRAGKLEGRIEQVQMLGRLLSTRHRDVKIAGRGRLLVPEGFREFLGVEQGSEVLVIGAAVCVELWRPSCWMRYLDRRIPRFRRLFDELSN